MPEEPDQVPQFVFKFMSCVALVLTCGICIRGHQASPVQCGGNEENPLVDAFQYPDKIARTLVSLVGKEALQHSALQQATTYTTHFSGIGTSERGYRAGAHALARYGVHANAKLLSCCVPHLASKKKLLCASYKLLFHPSEYPFKTF